MPGRLWYPTAGRVELGAASDRLQRVYADDFNGLALNGSQLAGFRNRVINGHCKISQRGTAALVNNGRVYGGPDRFGTFISATTASGSASQAVGYGTNPIPRSKTGLQVLATTTGSTIIVVTTRLERMDTMMLNGLTVTASCKVFQDTGLTLNPYIEIDKAGAADNFTSPVALGSTASSVPTSTWTTLSTTFTLGATDASNGIQLAVVYSGIAAVTSKNFQFTDWVLEEGSVVTPAEDRPLALELAMCQRYFYEIFPKASGLPISSGTNFSTTEAYHVIRFPTRMRKAPTASCSSAGDFNLFWNGGAYAATIAGFGQVGEEAAELYLAQPTPWTSGDSSWCRSNTANARLTFDAEL